MRGLVDRSLVRSQNVALKIIEQAASGERVDMILRQVLSREDLESAQRRAVSNMVFTYFRWFGLLDNHQRLRDQLVQAQDLAVRFAANDECISSESLRKTVPEWTFRMAEVDVDWLRLIQSPPDLWLRCQADKESAIVESIPGKFLKPELPPSVGSLCYQGETDLFRTSAFQEGCFEIQDLSSQWVAAICAPQSGELWWDACAGEGGKFLDLASRMANRGQIWVTDRSARRLKQLRRRAARAGVYNYRWRQVDLQRGDSVKSRFDGVLLDAPCSGLGTWQRNPDARWSTSIDTIAELASIQRDLLKRVSSRVKSGGRLVYAVCTLSTEETVEVADWFDANATGFVPWISESLDVPLNAKDSCCPNRFWFGRQAPGGNGMFVAVWSKR